MPPRSPEPGTFEHHLTAETVSIQSLVRLSRRPATEPFWSRGRSRFDGEQHPSSASEAFGTCYAGLDLETAFAESIIHDNGYWRDGFHWVPDVELTGRHIMRFEKPGTDRLVLADFRGPGLKRLGLNLDLTTGETYTLCRKWAAAVHQARPSWDGILYVSRQNAPGLAVAFFDTCGLQVASHEPLEGEELERLCETFAVVSIENEQADDESDTPDAAD